MSNLSYLENRRFDDAREVLNWAQSEMEKMQDIIDEKEKRIAELEKDVAQLTIDLENHL